MQEIRARESKQSFRLPQFSTYFISLRPFVVVEKIRLRHPNVQLSVQRTDGDGDSGVQP
jgi:hypothetical protein